MGSDEVLTLTEDDEVRAGLCASCGHVKVVVSARGSRFYLCRRSAEDPGFAKYPVLPVRRCPGYEELPVLEG